MFSGMRSCLICRTVPDDGRARDLFEPVLPVDDLDELAWLWLAVCEVRAPDVPVRVFDRVGRHVV